MTTQVKSFSEELGNEVKKASGWYIAFGVLLLLGGVAAVARPLHAGLTVASVVGWVLIINGIMSGIYIIQNPVDGLTTLTVVLGGVFFLSGIMRLLMAGALAGIPGVGTIIIGGIMSIVVGILIWMKLPAASEMVVGTLIGLDFIMNGLTIIMFGIGARSFGGAVERL